MESLKQKQNKNKKNPVIELYIGNLPGQRRHLKTVTGEKSEHFFFEFKRTSA